MGQPLPTGDLEGRVAIVTGASRGIGKACAVALARQGCDVVVLAKSTESTDTLPGSIYETQKAVEAEGQKAFAVACDVRFEDQIQAAIEKTLNTFGRIDILINNAGALWWQPVEDTPTKRFDLVMNVNARAAFIFARECIPHMKEGGFGHIINMSPPINLNALPGKVAYMISKYGMTMLTLGLSRELAETNIAVHSLWPRTIIESQASINLGLGDRSQWRTPDIVADAVVGICRRKPGDSTGHCLFDEDVLRDNLNITDFSHYACVPGADPPHIPWEETGWGE